MLTWKQMKLFIFEVQLCHHCTGNVLDKNSFLKKHKIVQHQIRVTIGDNNMKVTTN